ncbi:TonB-dependent receptor [Povalibacter sp.]|uniref:TonB-dependent receptor n=1 Tax=Povalibacter sp. TaxID=1962978 RepID=UPI002F3FA3D5
MKADPVVTCDAIERHEIGGHMTIRPIGFLSVLAVLAATDGANAAAEEEGYSGRAVEEILVTARRRTENLQDVPISIDVFSTADIEARSLTSLQELSQFSPNFSMYNNGIDGSLTSEVFMRGIGNSLGGPGVGIYLDGVYLSTQQAIDLGMVDLERVEVLRGPQGTLFGRNTIGGAVSFVTARPTGDFSGSTEVTVGSFDRFDAKLNLNGALIPGRLNGRIAVGTQKRDGYGRVLDYSTGKKIDEMGDRDRISGRVLLDWTVTDDIKVLFSVEATDMDEKATVRSIAEFRPISFHNLFNARLNPQPPVDQSLLPPDIYSTYGTYRGGRDNFNYMDSLGGSMTVDWSLSTDIFIKSITAWREYETGFGSDLDFTSHGLGAGNNYTDQDQFSQEFQINGASFNDRLDWILGLYYFSEDAFDPSTAYVFVPLTQAGLIPDLSSERERWSTNDSWAAFGEGTYHITDKLSVTGGLRYTKDEKTESYQQINIYDGSFICASCTTPLSGEMSIGDWSGRANVVYKWNDDISTYLSAARGFKSGGLINSVTSLSDVLNRDTLNAYLPEYVWTYELGMKSTLLDNRLRLNVAAFYSDYKDIQYSFTYIRPSGNNLVSVAVVSNAPTAEIKGFELEALLEPVDNLTLSASVGFTDAEYKSADRRGGPLTIDSEFLFTPKWSYTLSSQYKVPLDWGSLTARLDYAWKDKAYFEIQDTTNPLLQQQAYGLLNARVSVDFPSGWNVAAFGTNLTDEEYVLSAFYLPGLGVPAMRQPALPREWGVAVKYSF